VHRHAGPVRVLDGDTSRAELRGAAAEFAAALRECGSILGLDMEWVPDRCKQHNHKVALVQLAVGDVVWLVRTCRVGLPDFVRRAFLDPGVIKVVVGFDGSDRAKLVDSFALRVEGDPAKAGFLDIGPMAEECRATGVGLKRLAQRYGHQMRKDKRVSVSNWAASALSDAQRQYAADDAFFSLLVAGALLGEEATATRAQGATQSELRERARRAWALAEARVRAALRAEDCSAHDEAAEVLAEGFHELVAEAARERGEAAVPLDEVLRRARAGGAAPGLPSLLDRARRGGISLGKAFFLEQADLFAVTARKGVPQVRARAAAERAPPTEEELALPWAADPHGALSQWMAAEREKTGVEGYGAEGPSASQLQARLGRVGRVFERRGDHQDAAGVSMLVKANAVQRSCKNGTPPTADSMAPSAHPGKRPSQGRTGGAHAPAGAAARTVFVGRLPPDWTEVALLAAATASIGEGVLEEAQVPACPKGRRANRGWGLLVFRDPAAADAFLDAAGGAPEESERSLTEVGGALIAVGRYQGVRAARAA